MRNSIRLALAALVAGLALAGCGSSSDSSSASSSSASEVPQSAQDSIAGLVAYLNDLIANNTNSTSEPVRLGDVALPTSETSDVL